METTNAIGRPSLYSDEMVEKARAYINGGYKEYGQVFPSIVGMRKPLGVSTTTMRNWGKEHAEFLSILEDCVEEQELILLNSGLDGSFNSNITKLVLGKHGYHDKQDQNVQGNIVMQTTKDDADL